MEKGVAIGIARKIAIASRPSGEVVSGWVLEGDTVGLDWVTTGIQIDVVSFVGRITGEGGGKGVNLFGRNELRGEGGDGA